MSIVLKIGGSEHAGWKTAAVTRSIEQMSGNFEFTVSNRWPGSNFPNIRPGDASQISVNGITALTGYVDDILPSYAGTSHDIRIRGRSKTCDLIDCSIIEANQYTETSVEKIASDISAPFSISVRSEVDTGKAITEKVNAGDTPAEVISKISRMRGLIATDDVNGNLVFTRAGNARASRALINRKGETNIVSGQATFSMRDRFSRYRCIGQNVGTDQNYGTAVSQVKGEAIDSNVSRYRPHVVFAEKAADTAFCRDRATWERAWRAGESVQMQYVVNGWESSQGQLWQPNFLIAIEDDFIKISGTFLISKVRLSMGPNGELATLTCVLPEAFSIEPTIPKTNNTSKFWREIEKAGRSNL